MIPPGLSPHLTCFFLLPFSCRLFIKGKIQFPSNELIAEVNEKFPLMMPWVNECFALYQKEIFRQNFAVEAGIEAVRNYKGFASAEKLAEHEEMLTEQELQSTVLKDTLELRCYNPILHEDLYNQVAKREKDKFIFVGDSDSQMIQRKHKLTMVSAEVETAIVDMEVQYLKTKDAVLTKVCFFLDSVLFVFLFLFFFV